MAPWGTILVNQGYLGTHNRTPSGPDLDFYRFWEDFGTLLGPSLASVWLLFRVLGNQIASIGSRLVFLVIWEWKYTRIECLDVLKPL